MMDLSLVTAQKMVLSQKMRQSAEILQMSSTDLIEYIKELSIDNPVVDYDEPRLEDSKFDLLKKKLDWLDSTDEQNKTYYAEEKEDEKDNDMWKFKESDRQNLEDFLMEQINVLAINKQEQTIAYYIVECMDNNGYLTENDVSISNQLGVSLEDVRKVIQIIQSLDPPGVGATSLKECLLLQLKRLPSANPLAERIIQSELETLGKNQLHIIAKHLKVSIEKVTTACEIIKNLNPKPGNSFFSGESPKYIIPDATVEKRDSTYIVLLNDFFFPKIRISNFYKNLIGNDSSTDTQNYVYDKIRQAEWAVKCISRRNSTLIETIQTIVDIQRDFFDFGPGNLHPMKLNDISAQLNIHESTVSRAIKEKYIQCSWGVFPLNYFFVSSIHTRSSEETTPEKIKSQIQDILSKEDPSAPLSDRCITEDLNQLGFEISRRTVAKYREAMGIPGAGGRKRY